MKRVSTKFVPRLLTEDQKNNRLSVCYVLREQVGNDQQILSNVTGDETWCYGYDPEKKTNMEPMENSSFSKSKEDPTGSIKC